MALEHLRLLPGRRRSLYSPHWMARSRAGIPLSEMARPLLSRWITAVKGAISGLGTEPARIDQRPPPPTFAPEELNTFTAITPPSLFPAALGNPICRRGFLPPHS